MSDVWRYDGKRVVVTGCASGMGQEAARELIELGADVVGLDIAEPTVGVKEFHRLDLSDPASIDAVAAAVGGPVHALFNIAGISSGAAPALKVVEANFLGPRRLTQAPLPVMEAGAATASASALAPAGPSPDLPQQRRRQLHHRPGPLDRRRLHGRHHHRSDHQGVALPRLTDPARRQ